MTETFHFKIFSEHAIWRNFSFLNFFSVQFDEDEKPAAKSDGKESDDDGEVEEDPKDEKTNQNENHSDISENDSEPDSVSSDDEMEDGEKIDEKISPTKKQKRSSKSLSPQKVKPEDHSDISEEEDENFGKDHKGESNNTKTRYVPTALWDWPKLKLP